MRRIEGRDRMKIRVADNTVYRWRRCDSCHSEDMTAEFMKGRHNGNKADRCPRCIVGKGHAKRVTMAHKRPLVGLGYNPAADMAGAVTRARVCTNGCTDTKTKRRSKAFCWKTWEVRADGRAVKDITLCPCGGRMEVVGFWNPYLQRMEGE